MPALPKHHYTGEQYLALERKADYKSEYIDGQIYAMSGASREHNLISFNLIAALGTQLKGRPSEGYGSDMRVKIHPTGMYTYPDVTVVCGEAQFEDGQVDTLVNPTVIIEVLSPSTEAYDRGEKFAHYRKMESLTDYVLVAQDKMRVEHFVRVGDEGEQWMFTEVSDPAGILRLASISCDVAIQDIYDKVVFPAVDKEPTVEPEKE